LSARLSAPLAALAEGTRAVASGDFSEMPTVQSRDELGTLMRSFNRMTRQLAEAREVVDLNQKQLETAKAYLESILAHLSSGVLTFDERFILRAVNPSAEEILGHSLAALRGRRLYEWDTQESALQAFGQQVSEQFHQNGEQEWARQLEYAGKAGTRMLLVRGTRLPGGGENGYIVVFDDITHLLQAQRDAAWGEVARRLAHEIKNPLTPIQLSAERLEHKLVDKLPEAEAEMLKRATQTIVNQVAALKSMVNSFSEYARSPQLSLQALDLNLLVQEILAMYENGGAPIKLELAPGLPQIQGDATLLRQVVHNLLQNAQDALNETADPGIRVSTRSADKGIQLEIQDNGSGFPDHLMSRLYEPYVTTKPKGTGLGLAIVKKIVEEHHGNMQIENIQPHGACVSIFLPLKEAA